jgi:hypothetical protein
MELLPEEMDQESIELLPNREVMTCCRPCGGEFEVHVELEVCVDL